MRIGLLTTSFPRTPDDGAGVFVLQFAQALSKRGHTLEVLCPEPWQPAPAPSWPGIEITHVPYLRPRSWQRTFYGAGVPDNLRRDPRVALGLLPFSLSLAVTCAARARAWDALCSHWALPCALAAGAVRGSRPHLAVLHSADVHWLTKLPLRAQLAARIAQQATALWFVTEQQRATFLQLLPKGMQADTKVRTHVSAMGVEAQPPSIERSAARAQLGLRQFTVLAMGRLVAIKGLDTAIAAVGGGDLTLLIAGAGPEEAALRAQVARTGADVRFLGHVTGDAKLALWQAADAFVMPSRTLPSGRSEGVPHALLEALAHGLPVVASATGGMSPLLAPAQAARLVEPDDPRALRAALLELQQDRMMQERLRSAGLILAERHHWSVLAPQIEGRLRS